MRRRGCRGCLSGPRDCEARCEVPADLLTRGGRWYCDGSHYIQEAETRSLESCYYLCEGSRLQRLTCLSGTWDQDLSQDEQRFTCRVGREGLLTLLNTKSRILGSALSEM